MGERGSIEMDSALCCFLAIGSGTQECPRHLSNHHLQLGLRVVLEFNLGQTASALGRYPQDCSDILEC